MRIKRFWRRLGRIRVKRIGKSGGSGKPLIKVLAAIAVLLLLFAIISSRLTPLVREMAVSASTNVVTTAINNAISEKLISGELNYSDMITLEKDENGNVTALITDMARVNILKSEISHEIIKSITDERSAAIGIPIGNLVGGSIFSGIGPEIPVKIIAVSSASTDFTNKFSSAGINQTRHQIMIEVEVTVSVLIPGETVKTEVRTQLTVAETVIVGGVPNSYMYFEGGEERPGNTE